MDVVWVHTGSWKSHAAISYIGVHNAWSFAAAGYKTYLLMPDHGDPSDTDTDLAEFYGLAAHPNLFVQRVRVTKRWWNFRHPYFVFAKNFVSGLSGLNPSLILTREQRFLPFLAQLAKSENRYCLFEPHFMYANQEWRSPKEISRGDFKRGKLERTYLPKIDGIVSITADQRELYQKAFPTIPGLYAPLGVKLLPKPSEAEISERHNRRVVAYIGHLMRSKGIPNLLSVADSLRSENIRTAIFGGSAEEITALTEATPQVSDVVSLCPFVPPAKMFKALSESASIGIVALEDGFYNRHLTCPVKVLDFLALGMPIVACDLPSIRGVLGDAGLYFPPGDTSGMRRQIVRLMNDPELYLRLSRNAISQAVSLGWEARAQSIANWCKAVLH